MWRQIYDALKQLLLLKEQMDKTAADVKELQKEMKDLTAAVQRLAYEVHRNQEHEKHEREVMALRLENQLLRFERFLPGVPSKEEKKK